MDKTELMEMAKKHGLVYFNDYAGSIDGVPVEIQRFANAILERAATKIREGHSTEVYGSLSEWGKGWQQGALDAVDGAQEAIRSLKITEGGGA